MNKKLIAIIIAIVLLILGAAGYYFLNQKKAETSETQKETSSGTAENKSIKELLGLSTNQQCTFSEASSGTEGVVYVGSGKLRGDFTSKVEGKITNSHVIANGETMYFWMEGETNGFKVSQSSLESLGTSASQVIDVNKEVEYSCLPWAGVSNIFDAPKEISFTDYSKFIPSSLPSTDSSAQCAACASLSGDAKTQCETALKCN